MKASLLLGTKGWREEETVRQHKSGHQQSHGHRPASGAGGPWDTPGPSAPSGHSSSSHHLHLLLLSSSLCVILDLCGQAGDSPVGLESSEGQQLDRGPSPPVTGRGALARPGLSVWSVSTSETVAVRADPHPRGEDRVNQQSLVLGVQAGTEQACTCHRHPVPMAAAAACSLPPAGALPSPLRLERRHLPSYRLSLAFIRILFILPKMY